MITDYTTKKSKMQYAYDIIAQLFSIFFFFLLFLQFSLNFPLITHIFCRYKYTKMLLLMMNGAKIYFIVHPIFLEKSPFSMYITS